MLHRSASVLAITVLLAALVTLSTAEPGARSRCDSALGA